MSDTPDDCCARRERLRRLAAEAAATIERLRSVAAGRDLLTVHEYRAAGLLIGRLKEEAGVA